MMLIWAKSPALYLLIYLFFIFLFFFLSFSVIYFIFIYLSDETLFLFEGFYFLRV